MTRRRDALLALGLGVAALVVYRLTGCRAVYWYDSAEYVAAAATLGIPHPPGYPLYTLLGHLFTWLPMPAAEAVNLMSGVFGAAAVALAYLLGRQLGGLPFPAAMGALALGSGRLFWSNAVVAEVYTGAVAAVAVVWWLLFRALETGRRGFAVAAAGAAGLGLGIHYSIATCGLGYLLAVLAASDREAAEGRNGRGVLRLFAWEHLRRSAPLLVRCAGATFLGSLVFLYLPIRGSMGPLLNIGDVATLKGFLWTIRGGIFTQFFDAAPSVFEGAARVGSLLALQTPWPVAAAAALGFASLARARPVLAASLGLGAAGNVAFFFRYGVHDAEVFFLPAGFVLALLAGHGVGVALAALRGRDGERRLAATVAAAALALAPVARVAALWREMDLSDYRAAERYGMQVAAELPKDARLVLYYTPSEWKYLAVFGFYVRYALGLRRDVKILQHPKVSEVAAWLEEGMPLYLVYPVPEFVARFEVVPEGALYRIVRKRPAPGG